MLLLDAVSLTKAADPEIGNAFRLYQLGHYQWALDALERATIADGESDGCSLLRQEASRHLNGSATRPPAKLVWQILSDSWESEWIRFLFAGSYGEEVTDMRHEYTAPRMIVVDNLLTAEKVEYFRQASLAGCEITLIHLSDEGFNDDIGAYKWCTRIYRNYWSRLFAHDDRIVCFPLGPRRGIALNKRFALASRRKWLWGFAGHGNKSDRAEMVAEMSSLADGYVHLTSGFASPDGLSTEQYEEMLGQVAFAPCPSGFVNIDTFRVYEALECGAIPIVERRHNHDYFGEMCGPHPMPTVSSWRETPHLLAQIGSGADLDRLQQRCSDWWSTAKLQLRAKIARNATL